jgi:putative ABC transport system permease protein
VDAWYAGAEGASSTRLITRSAISLVVPLPITYREKPPRRSTVSPRVTTSNWFGGVYVTPKNFFPQFAVDGETYFALYPSSLDDAQYKASFMRDRKGAVVGRKLARPTASRSAITVPLRGTIFPGNWEFVVRGIYDGREPKTDTNQFIFHWQYLNETVKRLRRGARTQVGIYIVGIDAPDRAAEISELVDAQFRNSLAETLTETEKSFQLGFVAMTEAIVVAIRIVSYLVIFIIMAVMANTMAMTARERLPEYATLKALGFSPARRWPHLRGVGLHRRWSAARSASRSRSPSRAWFGQAMGRCSPSSTSRRDGAAADRLFRVRRGGRGDRRGAGNVRIADGLRAVA